MVQTAGFLLGGARFLEWCRRRYGDAVTFGTLFDQQFVMIFDPELVKEVFQGSNRQLHAGEANALLGPILGERSVLLLDGAEHLRHRKLMLPAFHGQQMAAHAQTMRDAADLEIDAWPVGQPFALLPSMQSLTLRIILRAVFGYEPGPAEAELRSRLRAMVEPLARPRGMLMVSALLRGRGDRRGALEFETRKRAVDEILYAEIARRRGEPDLAERDDVFSALLLARDEDGAALSDGEIRDELLTLLLAGHETTATGLAWTLDLLLHDERVLGLARRGDERYLDAVVKEALRIRPVIPGVGRVVREAPFRLGPYEVPPGIEINPSIRTIHRRAELYPEPARFAPERFLGADAPGHLHLGPVRRRHSTLSGGELRADGDAHHPRAGAGADRADGGRRQGVQGSVPRHHPVSQGRRPRPSVACPGFRLLPRARAPAGGLSSQRAPVA